MNYEDFSLKIEPKQGDSYPVIVLRSPAGEGRSSFQFPFDPDEIGDILFDLGQTVRGTGIGPLRDISPAATRTGPQQIGDQLFNALFAGPVRSLLDRSLGMLHGHQRGLRIKLHIDPEDPSLAQLASLPWEFMYRKETRDFLNLSRFTPILRYLDVQRPYIPLPLELPLRILVIISAPIDYVTLDLDGERAQIETSWAKLEGVQVEFMERATILTLQDRLADQPYHVLHYMGHGGFDERTGQGVLVMEDEDGRGAMVDGSTLGILLRDLPTMRIVFLNACETARVTKEKGLDPFAGVAASMVMAGIPAVVAMQFPITDRAAITFAQKFYPLLARGDPVDAAVAEGRRAIRLAEARTMEWGTPVLFMRAPEGVIFRVSEAQREKVPVPQIPELPEEIDEALEQRLAELYTRGLSAFWLEEWEKAAHSFQTIVDVQADYEDAADKLAEAKRQANLHTLYARAQSAQEAEDWPGALTTLEELAAEAADFKDTAERLEVVRMQKQLADLYAEAKRLHQAQQWQAVINVFGQIRAIEQDYADPDELLPTAEREVAEQKRQAELTELYSHAVRKMDSRRWQEARQLLAQVQEIEPGFGEAERLLERIDAEIAREEAEQFRQEQIATLYEKALGLATVEQWQQVLETMEEIQALDSQFSDPEGLTARAQEEVEHRRRLEELYAQAQASQAADDWPAALSTLEELVAVAPDFKDSMTQLGTVETQKQLADLYAEARQFLQAKQWQAVVNTFAQIHSIEPEYPDPDELLPTAERAAAALKRQAELNDLYGRAVHVMDAEHWAEARLLLAQVQEMEPGFRETARLMTDSKAEIERQATERQRQEQIATLYEQALGLARARQWRQALDKIEAIKTLDPQFADLEGLAVRAQEEVAMEEEEARRQGELAVSYAEAVRLLRAGQFQEALEKWGEVRARDPRYPDRQKVQAKSKRKLAALGKRHLPGRMRVLGGAIVIITTVVGLLATGIVQLQSQEAAAPALTSGPTTIPMAADTTTEIVFSGEVFFNHGVSLYDRGDYEEAIAQFNLALALGWETAELYHARGRSCHMWHYFQSGCSLEQAIADSTKAIELDPSKPGYWEERGDAYMDHHNPRAALNDFNQSIKLDSQSAGSYVNRGSAYMGIGEEALAMNDWINAIELDPQACDAYTGLGNFHREMGDYQMAIENLSKAIEICPTLGHNYIYRGWIYFDQPGDSTLALSDFSKAIEVEPDKHSYYFERGQAFEHLGQVAEARADYTKYFELTESFPNAESRDEVQQWLAEHPE